MAQRTATQTVQQPLSSDQNSQAENSNSMRSPIIPQLLPNIQSNLGNPSNYPNFQPSATQTLQQPLPSDENFQAENSISIKSPFIPQSLPDIQSNLENPSNYPNFQPLATQNPKQPLPSDQNSQVLNSNSMQSAIISHSLPNTQSNVENPSNYPNSKPSAFGYIVFL